jgi:hypothetical protein
MKEAIEDYTARARLFGGNRMKLGHGIQLQPWLKITTFPRSVEAQLERHRARLTDLIDDRRFAETIYRVALADGIMDCVTYQDPPEGAS